MTTEAAEELSDFMLGDLSLFLSAGRWEKARGSAGCPLCLQRLSCILPGQPEGDALKMLGAELGSLG